jgi:hypothetical protein
MATLRLTCVNVLKAKDPVALTRGSLRSVVRKGSPLRCNLRANKKPSREAGLFAARVFVLRITG